MIDLHCHTTCSDGTLTPAELIAEAGVRGITTLAITDHDTLDAYDRLPPVLDVAELIRGIELSIDFPSGTFHLLGYLVDPHEPRLLATVEQLQAWRSERNELILDKLVDAGLPINADDMAALAEAGQVGRPHLARLLMRRGAVTSVQEAFDRYLAAGQPCYVPKSRLDLPTALDLLHGAGGAAVLAHPYQLKLSDADLTSHVAEWARRGLDGIEVYYPVHTPAMLEFYDSLADAHGLVRTGGSDFHGALKPSIILGELGHELPPDEVILEPLRAAAERWR